MSMTDAEYYATSALEGIPNVVRIAIRLHGENIAHWDIFPGDGNNGGVMNIDFEDEFKAICLHASEQLRNIAMGEMNGNYSQDD